jgi:hypothetical protein
MKRRRNGVAMPALMLGGIVAALFVRAFGPELVRYLRIKQM